MFKYSARRQILAALVGANHGATVRRATLATALALSISSIPTHAAIVDGSLSDLIAEVAASPYNTASGTDPQGSADSPATENNNGFDIKNVYASYNVATDMLYLGLNVYGTVGNSLPVGSAALNEGIANLGAGSNSKTVFDANETYGIQLYRGTTTSDPQLLLFNVKGVNDGTDTPSSSNSNPYLLTITRAVSEANNGVEFSIAGLSASGALPAFSFANPANLLIRFSAGSGDTNTTSLAAEDSHLLQMQAVPVPAAAWLFGSGLVGLLAAVGKNRKTA